MNNYDSIMADFTRDIAAVDTADALYNVKVHYWGKKGIVSELSKKLGSLSPDERPKAGAEIGRLRAEFERLHDEKERALKFAERAEQLKNERLDITLPGVGTPGGSLHLINQVNDEVTEIFTAMGYSIATGPEAEHSFFNFEALNMPPGHPARDMHDTFYLSGEHVLRTHTSPVQIRTMIRNKPPIKIIAPGKVYRSDYDITHSPMFHQMEGLLVDKHISLTHLKGTLEHFLRQIFPGDLPMRFRSSYFPFTEPSMEVDIGCSICGSKGCRVCKGCGWLEIAGCGMVAPEVFAAVNIDASVYSGFAFGMGIERIAMLKHGIDDLRLFFENRTKFVTQF